MCILLPRATTADSPQTSTTTTPYYTTARHGDKLSAKSEKENAQRPKPRGVQLVLVKKADPCANV